MATALNCYPGLSHPSSHHENEIGGTTDVPTPNSPPRDREDHRRRGRGRWFTEDFTLGELKRPRARERILDLRTGNRRGSGP